ncbi:MAG TPA: L-histidine N(alpha)-methyltransferase [Chloroflexota bacterium]|nr:L-histidine N(alpha)-methyltransferase [Chloroflexota bacterium]
MAASGERLVLDRYVSDSGVLHGMAEEVARGLTAQPKWLPSKYFYDERGSALFEEITQLPEYYQTRTEAAILRAIAGALIARFGFGSLVEIGSGSATKTRLLLDAMERQGVLREYVPFDVSESILRASAEALLRAYPTLTVHGVVGDFQQHLDRVPPASSRRLAIFLGSTIGNLDREERRVFLSRVRGMLRVGDALLLGVDLVKDIARLEAAYNDAAGVTAEFNRNILCAINNALAADFIPDAYRHRAFFNMEEERIEMHLIPDSPQRVTLPACGIVVDIDPAETIRTEISCKFTRESTTEMLESAGLDLDEWHTDDQQLFALAVAVPRGA